MANDNVYIWYVWFHSTSENRVFAIKKKKRKKKKEKIEFYLGNDLMAKDYVC